MPGTVQYVATAATATATATDRHRRGDDAHTPARPSAALQRFGRVPVEPDGAGDGIVHHGSSAAAACGTVVAEHLGKVDRSNVGPYLPGPELGQEHHGGAPSVGADGRPQGLDLGDVGPTTAPAGRGGRGGVVDPVRHQSAESGLPLDALPWVGRVGPTVEPPLGEGEAVRHGQEPDGRRRRRRCGCGICCCRRIIAGGGVRQPPRLGGRRRSGPSGKVAGVGSGRRRSRNLREGQYLGNAADGAAAAAAAASTLTLEILERGGGRSSSDVVIVCITSTDAPLGLAGGHEVGRRRVGHVEQSATICICICICICPCTTAIVVVVVVILCTTTTKPVQPGSRVAVQLPSAEAEGPGEAGGHDDLARRGTDEHHGFGQRRRGDRPGATGRWDAN